MKILNKPKHMEKRYETTMISGMEYSAEMIKKDNKIIPVCCIFRDNDIYTIPSQFTCNEDKELFRDIVFVTCRKINADALIFISDVYFVKKREEDIIQGETIIPRIDPGRREAILGIFMLPDGRSDVLSYIYDRLDNIIVFDRETAWLSDQDQLNHTMLFPWA